MLTWIMLLATLALMGTGLQIILESLRDSATVAKKKHQIFCKGQACSSEREAVRERIEDAAHTIGDLKREIEDLAQEIREAELKVQRSDEQVIGGRPGRHRLTV